MPAKLPETASLEWLIDYAAGVEAAVGALPATATLTPSWQALRLRLRAARDARDDDRFKLRAAEARARVADAQWDRALTTVSAEAFHIAGKDAAAVPYSILFGSVKAKDAVALGAFKATAFGAALLQKATSVKDARLDAVVAELDAAQKTLEAATAARLAARNLSLTHDGTRQLLIDAVEEEMAQTEVGILTAQPGRRDLVDAALGLPGRGRSKDDDEPTPVVVPTA